jgi:hypothetical protein
VPPLRRPTRLRSAGLVNKTEVFYFGAILRVYVSCRVCKPNSVCCRSSTTVIPLGRALLHGSSDLPGSCDAPSQHVPAVLAIQAVA